MSPIPYEKSDSINPMARIDSKYILFNISSKLISKIIIAETTSNSIVLFQASKLPSTKNGKVLAPKCFQFP
jgi:hypothetical protein